MEHDDEGSAIRALEAGIAAGVAHVDTAEMYGQGRVERLVARAIRRHREQVFLASKVLPTNASHEQTIRACERSLRRLGTDYLDLYLLHWRGRTPLAETFGAFETLRESGRIRAWGVSNFDVPDLEEAVRTAGPGLIACNQVLYHLQERSIEFELTPYCRQNDIAIVAYSPLGSGRFPAARSHGGQVLAGIAAAHQATPVQIALAFLIRDPGVFAIPKAARVDHAVDNAKAADIHLTRDEIAAIDAAFPARPRRHLAML